MSQTGEDSIFACRIAVEEVVAIVDVPALFTLAHYLTARLHYAFDAIVDSAVQAYVSDIFTPPSRGGGKDPQLRDDKPPAPT